MLSETPVISETIEHDFFKYPAEQTDSYDKQQARIDKHLKEKMVEFLDKYLSEKDITAKEGRLDTAADKLKTEADALYSSK